MPKKDMTPEERKAFGEKMKAARAAKAEAPVEVKEDTTTHVAPEQSVTELQAQIAELKAAMQQLAQAPATAQTQQPRLNSQGSMVGEFEKYSTDASLYPDPTERLANEPKLQPLAFKHNYELVYTVSTSNYQTQSGTFVKEPKFRIQLNRIVLDDQGEKTDKRYIARILTFHEDPAAAMTIARENGLEIDNTNEAAFLNDMRYYRVRDWLFSIFWPKPADEKGKINQEVIGGSIVQVFTKSSEDSSKVEFDKLSQKLKA